MPGGAPFRHKIQSAQDLRLRCAGNWREKQRFLAGILLPPILTVWPKWILNTVIDNFRAAQFLTANMIGHHDIRRCRAGEPVTWKHELQQFGG
jgi:hypothetical protein